MIVLVLLPIVLVRTLRRKKLRSPVTKTNPELAAFIVRPDPATITQGYKQPVTLRCPACQKRFRVTKLDRFTPYRLHEAPASIEPYTLETKVTAACPKCGPAIRSERATAAQKRKNIKASLVGSNIFVYFDAAANPDLDPTLITPKTNRTRLFWRCDQNQDHTWQETPSTVSKRLVNRGTGCPKCAPPLRPADYNKVYEYKGKRLP